MTNANCVGSPASANHESDLTILGASARAAAQSARRAGLRPFAADLFADTDLQVCCPSVRLSRYPDDFPEILREAPTHPWIYTGALENYPALVAQLAAIRPLYGNGAATLVRVRNPWQVAEALERHGLACPALASGPDRLPADGTWLRKSRRSAGGLQVSAWHGEQLTPAGVESERSAQHFFQQRIEGLPCSAVYVAAAGRALLVGVTEQLLAGKWIAGHQAPAPPGNSGDFRYAGSIGPLAIDTPLQAAFQQIGQVLAAEFRLVGLFGVDCILADGVPWPVEINPRYTASIEIIERAAGVQAIAWHLKACSEAELPTVEKPQLAPQQIWGKAILSGLSDLRIDKEAAEFLTIRSAILPFPLLSDIPAAGARIAAGQPILTAFATGESREVVADRLRARLAEVEGVIFGRPSADAIFA